MERDDAGKESVECIDRRLLEHLSERLEGERTNYGCGTRCNEEPWGSLKAGPAMLIGPRRLPETSSILKLAAARLLSEPLIGMQTAPQVLHSDHRRMFLLHPTSHHVRHPRPPSLRFLRGNSAQYTTKHISKIVCDLATYCDDSEAQLVSRDKIVA